jgi:hypothetical protein
MSLIGHFDKAPQEREPYEIDLKNVLSGEQIREVVWVSSAPLELPVGETSTDGAVIRAWLSGGRVGQTYTVTAHIRTSGGRELVRSFTVHVSDDRGGHDAAVTKGLSGLGQAPLPTDPAQSEGAAAARIVLTLGLSMVLLLPALWVGGRAFKVRGLDGWRLVGMSAAAAGVLTFGMIFIAALRRTAR